MDKESLDTVSENKAKYFHSKNHKNDSLVSRFFCYF